MKIVKLIEGLEVLIEVSGRQPQSGNLRPKMSAEVSNYQHNANIQDQIVQEFRGLAEGVMADGVLNDSEIEYLRKWSLKRREFLKGFPLSQFFSVISKNNTDEIKSFLTEMVFDEYSDQVHLKSIFDVVDKIDFHDRWLLPLFSLCFVSVWWVDPGSFFRFSFSEVFMNNILSVS